MVNLLKRKVAQKDAFKPIKNEVVRFTSEFAQKVRDMPEFIGERRINENHVEKLAIEMEKGNFIWKNAEIALAQCSWDNTLRRVNGNHTCYARSLLEGKSPKIEVTTYRAHTEEDFRKLYSKFDRGYARGVGHVIDIMLIGTSEFQDVSKSTLTKLSQGYKSWTGVTDPDIVTNKLLYTHNHIAHKVVPYIEQILSHKSHNYLKRAPVFGAMFETFSKCDKDSRAFWDLVISGLGFTSRYDPPKMLREWLQSHCLKNSDGSRRSQVASSEDAYRACILAFNHHRTKKEVRAIKPTNTKKRPRAK